MAVCTTVSLLVQITVVFPSIVKLDGTKKFLLSGNEEPLAIMTLAVLVFFKTEIVPELLTADAKSKIFKLTNVEHKMTDARANGIAILFIARIVVGFVLNIVEAVS